MDTSQASSESFDGNKNAIVKASLDSLDELEYKLVNQRAAKEAIDQLEIIFGQQWLEDYSDIQVEDEKNKERRAAYDRQEAIYKQETRWQRWVTGFIAGTIGLLQSAYGFNILLHTSPPDPVPFLGIVLFFTGALTTALLAIFIHSILTRNKNHLKPDWNTYFPRTAAPKSLPVAANNFTTLEHIIKTNTDKQTADLVTSILRDSLRIHKALTDDLIFDKQNQNTDDPLLEKEQVKLVYKIISQTVKAAMVIQEINLYKATRTEILASPRVSEKDKQTQLDLLTDIQTIKLDLENTITTTAKDMSFARAQLIQLANEEIKTNQVDPSQLITQLQINSNKAEAQAYKAEELMANN